MWPLLILLLFSAYNSSAEMSVVMTINPACNVTISNRLCVNEEFIFQATSNFMITSFDCYANYIKHIKYSKLEYKNLYYYNILKATKEMNGNWTCYWNNKTESCSFYLQVLPYLVNGNLEVNGVYIDAKAVSDVQWNGHYTFFEGELVSVRCLGTVSKFLITGKYSSYPMKAFLKLSYIRNDNLTLETGVMLRDHLDFKMKLTSVDDGAFVDCYAVATGDKEKPQIHLSRLYFEFNNTEKGLGFQVNGLTLTPIQVNKQSIFFKYYYYDGEELEIVSFKDELKYGDMDCKDERDQPWIENFKNFSKSYEGVYFKNIMKNKKNVTLICKVAILRSSRTKFKVNSSIATYLQLIPKITDYSPLFIIGLSMANILRQCHINEFTELIIYEFNSNKYEYLSLKCYSENTIPNWKFNSNIVNLDNYTSYTKQYLSNKYYNVISGRFKVNYRNKTPVLTCVSSENVQPQNRKVVVRLIPKKNSLDPDVKTTDRGLTDILVACGAALVVIAVMTWTVFYFRKQKRATRHRKRYENETLPRHSNEQTPVIDQTTGVSAIPADTTEIETYSVPYTGKTIDEMYTKPIPKHKRTILQPTYAELLFKEANNPYSSVHLPSHNLKSYQENYIQILPNANKNSQSDDPNYANSSINSSNYVNIDSGRQGYVNADCRDNDTEPAYCEVSLKK